MQSDYDPVQVLSEPRAFPLDAAIRGDLLLRCIRRRADHRLDPAPNIEVADNLHPAGLHRSAKVIQDPVDRALIEDRRIAEAPEVELETLQLDAALGRYVRDVDDSKIRRPSLQQRQFRSVRLHTAQRTKRREFLTFHPNLIRAFGVRIGEGLEQLGAWHGSNLAATPACDEMDLL